MPYVQQTFPERTREEIYTHWFKADKGEISSLDVWAAIGFQGDLEKVEKGYLDTLELNEGFLDFVKEAGKKYKLAIISNDASRWSRYVREKFGLNPYFDVISISADLKMSKPDERIFWLTLEKLGVSPEECLYVDDREKNLEAARKVGMETVMINSRHVDYDGEIVAGFAELLERIG